MRDLQAEKAASDRLVFQAEARLADQVALVATMKKGDRRLPTALVLLRQISHNTMLAKTNRMLEFPDDDAEHAL